MPARCWTSAWPGRLDEQVRDRIVAESRGNPLALLELPRGLTPAELAGGFELPDATPLASQIEQSFLRQLESLPDETRLLLLTAAAEPVGDVALLWRAAEQLGIGADAAAPAQAAGLIELGARVRFRHPLVRSAVYRAASRDRPPGGASRPGRGDRSGRRSRSSRLASRARRRRASTRPSPTSWSARPGARGLAAASRRPPRSSSARPS